VISGSLPRAGIEVTVTDPWGNENRVVSGSKLEYGPGGFEVVAPHLVTYTIRFLDQRFEVPVHDGATIVHLREEVTRDMLPDVGAAPDLGALPEDVRPRGTGWQMDVEYRPGPRIIAGSLPRAGIEVTVADPWGNASRVVSGSKAEYGPGGFEVVAPHAVTHTVSFLDQRFEVPVRDGSAIVTFTESGVPGQPEPPPEEPTPPPEEPTPPPTEPPPPTPTPPSGSVDEKWAQVMERLERIETLLRALNR
jgi:hypothetical protein